MIRLAFVIDKQDVIGHANSQENRERIEALPDGVMEQIAKVSQNSHFIVGRNSYELYTASDFSEQHKLYVLSKNSEFQLSQPGVEVVRDYRVLIEKFMTSKEIVTVFGGGEVLSLFLCQIHLF
jgi:dihydrofolate reductase